MSLDTADRFKADFITNIADVYTDYEYSYTMDNDGIELENYGAGPVIEVNVEPFDDEFFGVCPAGDPQEYQEEGLFVIRFYTELGSGSNEAGTFYTILRNQYRQSEIAQGVGEEGTIYIDRISRRPRVEVRNPRDERDWVRHDMFLAYQKYYDI
jgi:hypothetical protein